MRYISFALTERQFLARIKDITRRAGWLFLKPGDHLMGVRKAMGLKRGEKIVQLGEIEVVSVRRERLDAITQDDVRREGFPDWKPADFVAFYKRESGTGPDEMVTRIEFRYVEPEGGHANQT